MDTLLVASALASLVFVLIVFAGTRRTSLRRAAASAILGAVIAAVCWITVSNVNEANGAFVVAAMVVITLVMYGNAKRGGVNRRS